MEDKRKMILDAAMTLFSEKGYSGTGLREIAEKAAVSIGNIYNYFKNKKEIFDTILSPDKIMASLATIPVMMNEEFPNNLNKLILKAKNVVDEEIELYKLIFIDLIEFNGENTNKTMDMVIQFTQSSLEEKIRNNEVTSYIRNMDYKLFVKSFILMMIPFFVTTNILPAARIQKSDEEMAEMLANVFLHGIAT
ncbi:MAG: TetR/AcrR family transcriptional regulator [bacterium]|nr:TetR/AcrR family transcriptional regulator [bacterium]